MKTVVLYHPESDHSASVQQYAADFEKLKDRKLELVSLESREGADIAELYDVTRYPAVVVMSDDGHLQKLWQGGNFPLMDELAYYDQDPEADISHEGIATKPITS